MWKSFSCYFFSAVIVCIPYNAPKSANTTKPPTRQIARKCQKCLEHQTASPNEIRIAKKMAEMQKHRTLIIKPVQQTQEIKKGKQ